MPKSLFPDDDSLPTWLHTFALFFVVSFFALPMLWWGIEAIFTQYLEPISGPEFSQYLFGPTILKGGAAVFAGFSLIIWSCSFFAIAARFTRMGQDVVFLRWLPWVLLAISILLGFIAEKSFNHL